MPHESVASTILSFEDARHLVEHHAAQLRPHGRELVELLDSAGQILAEPILADRNFPPFPRSTRDGYAVRAEDVQNVPATLDVTGEIKAGADVALSVSLGQAVSIMTGGAVPAGANAVVMVEYSASHGKKVEISRTVSPGENVVLTGSEAKKNDKLLTPGMRIDHNAIAVAASVGRTRLLVYSKPKVALLSTGDELVDIDVPPLPKQIRNSNSYSLAAQVRAAGGEPILLPIAPDEPERLRELIVEGLEADLLLLTGGVSMGKYDLVEQVLKELNAEFFFTGAQIQPGRPVVFGRIASPETAGHRYFFGLPGNPVSTMVTFKLFVQPILSALAGMELHKLIFSRAKLKSEIKTKTGLTRFLPAVLSGEFDQAQVELVPWHGSGDIAATARSNCYAVIPPDREKIPAGERISILPR